MTWYFRKMPLKIRSCSRPPMPGAPQWPKPNMPLRKPAPDAGTTADEYRMPEMPSAFFRPMLTTDDNGRMQFSFTAPNANTTWKLCAVAFSRDLLSGSLTREIISSKPVMAQPNLPRFLAHRQTPPPFWHR